MQENIQSESKKFKNHVVMLYVTQKITYDLLQNDIRNSNITYNMLYIMLLRITCYT